MFLIGFMFYEGQRPGLRVGLGLVLGFLGAGLLIKPPQGQTTESLLGAMAVAIAPVSWSIGSLESRRRGSQGLLLGAMQMLAGGAMMLLVGSLLGEWGTLLNRSVSLRSVSAFFYLTVVGSLIGFTTFTWLFRVASPTAVSTYAYVNPLVAVLLGWLLADEPLDTHILLAAGLIVSAVILITLPAALFQPSARVEPATEPFPQPVLSNCSGE
jgi:drug/metabolite transporter (DMT)-like permease